MPLLHSILNIFLLFTVIYRIYFIVPVAYMSFCLESKISSKEVLIMYIKNRAEILKTGQGEDLCVPLLEM